MDEERKELELVSSNVLAALVALDEGLAGCEFISQALLRNALEVLAKIKQSQCFDAAYEDSDKKTTRTNPILVAGMGSCGTTMVCNRLSSSGFTFVKDLEEISKRKNYHRTCIKTHDFAPEHNLKYRHGPEITKCIYLFAEPKNVVVRAAQMEEEHWHNLHVDEKYFGTQEYLSQDIFRLKEQFLSWLKPHNNYDVLAIRYEALWSHQDDIKDFVGDDFSFTLPDYKPRKTNWEEHPAADKLQNTYSALSYLITSTEDISLNNKLC